MTSEHKNGNGQSGNGVAARVAAGIPPARWIRPLATFLGDEEPSDDDSQDWNLRNIIPRNEPWIWGGPPKSGKTWAMLDVAICVAMGIPWLGGGFENTLREPARVLVIALEDGQRRLRKRVWELCRGHGISPNDPTLREHLVISRETLRLPSKIDERAFAAEITQWKPAVVVVDNLTRIMVGDQNSIKDVSRFTQLWTQLCSGTGAAIGFLHHTGKKTEVDRNPFEQLRGSSDLLAATRNAIVSFQMEVDHGKASEVYIGGNLDLSRDELVIRFERQVEQGAWRTRLTDEGDLDEVRTTARKLKAEARAKERADTEAERRRKAVDLAMREDGRISSVDLGRAIGTSPKTALATLQALAKEGVMEVVYGPGGGYRIRPGGGA